MASWSTRRKASYLSIVFGAIFLLVVVPVFFLFYQKPTCFDGKKNGDESGVDCGGKCQLLCSFEALDTVVLWSRAFKVTDGVYSAVAYIENPNINSEATVGYIFKFYDSNNVLITTREGNVFIPKNKQFAVFEPNILTHNAPARVTFDFTKKPVWKRDLTPDPEVAVSHKTLVNSETRPRIDAVIENHALSPVSNIEVVAIVYDGNENAIGASRTFVDRIDEESTSGVTFTWPTPFQTKEQICRVKSDDIVGERPESLGVMLAIDRSGSMTSDGKNPPEPLTTVKNAADIFVSKLRNTDVAGVVSFATTATDPVDSSLTSNYDNLKSSIDNISILSNGTQYTNLGDGIDKAMTELTSASHKDLTSRVLVLLTDGIATKPEKAGEKDYPSTFAQTEASEAKKLGIELYIIGLGKDVNADFLEKLATAPDHYFAAASSDELENIYKQIAVKICKNGPSVVEIIPRVIPQ
jgi:Mg-chelatase subunit ChlD